MQWERTLGLVFGRGVSGVNSVWLHKEASHARLFWANQASLLGALEGTRKLATRGPEQVTVGVHE